MKKWLAGWLMCGVMLVSAQDGCVQEFQDKLADGEVHFYELTMLDADQVLYVIAESLSDTLDPYLVLGDPLFNVRYAGDDDGGPGTDSRLIYRVEEAGNYVLAIAGLTPRDSGGYRLLVGLDAPDVLFGNADSTGEVFVNRLFDDTPVPDIPTSDVCSELNARPQLSGARQTFETQNFILHYTLEGRDGATPFFVEQVAAAVELTWQHHINELGWAVPPFDCGEGGDQRFDVYIQELLDQNHLGVATRGTVIGDNPNTDAVELTAAYSYLTIDNDFSVVAEPLGVMRSTVAHEFMHNIQFGYDSQEEYFGIYESTATLMEVMAFPQDEIAYRYVPTMFEYPDTCPGGFPEEPAGLLVSRVYSEWMWLDSLRRDAGDEILLTIWEDLVVRNGLTGFYLTLADAGIRPKEAILRMAIRNLLRDYGRGDRFEGTVRVESNINGPGVVVPRRDGVQQLGVDYMLVTQPGRYNFVILDGWFELTVVGVDQSENTATVYPLGQRGVVDTTRYDYTYVLILNTRQHHQPERCEYFDWQIEVFHTDDPVDTPTDEVWNAVNFIPAG